MRGMNKLKEYLLQWANDNYLPLLEENERLKEELELTRNLVNSINNDRIRYRKQAQKFREKSNIQEKASKLHGINCVITSSN